MAQWLKHSPPNNEDLSSIPSIYMKLDALVHICNPTTPMVRQEMGCRLASLTDASLSNRSPRKQVPQQGAHTVTLGPHTWIQKHTLLNTHTHTHTPLKWTHTPEHTTWAHTYTHTHTPEHTHPSEWTHTPEHIHNTDTHTWIHTLLNTHKCTHTKCIKQRMISTWLSSWGIYIWVIWACVWVK